MHKTIQYSLIFLNLIVFISIVMGDAFDETVAEIQDLETTLNSELTSIEQELIELRENHPLNAPKDTFESDADYQKRLSELDAIVAEHRAASLPPIADIRSQISLLYRRVFLTNDIIGTLGNYDANNGFFPITFETADDHIAGCLFVKKADAKALHDNWEQVRVIGWISIDPGYRRGLARVNLEYPSLWKDGLTWTLDRLYDLGNNNSIAFSPNGKYIATGSNDEYGIADIWKVEDGKKFRKMDHGDWVYAVAFSPNGQYFATAGQDETRNWAHGKAIIWEISNGTKVHKLEHPSYIYAAAFSPNGNYLATTRQPNWNQGRANLWNVNSGDWVRSMTYNASVNTIQALMFSSSGKFLATGNVRGSWNLLDKATLWETSSGSVIQHFEHKNGVYAVAFSPNGKYIATGNSGSVTLWEMSSGRSVRQIELPNTIVYSAVFSPDGEFLAIGQGNGYINFLHIGTETITFETDILSVKSIYAGSEVTDLAWSPSGNLISDGKHVYRTLLNPEIHELESETVPEPSQQVSITFIAPSTVSVGESFTAALTLEKAQYVAGISLTLYFDPTVLKVKDVQEGDFLLGGEPEAPFFHVETDSAQGVLSGSGVKMIRKVGKATGGVLLKVVFEAKSARVSTIEVRNVTLGNAAGQSISVEATAGKVEVTSASDAPKVSVNVDPDVNGDGKVNILDLVRVSQSFGPAADAPDIDINGDGKIDILDLILVATKIGK